MAWLLGGGLNLMQMVKYYIYLVFQAIAMIHDSKIQNCEHILVPGGSNKWGPTI